MTRRKPPTPLLRIGLALALLLAGCMPQVIGAGPPITTATVRDTTLVMPDGARLPLYAWLPEGPPHAVLLTLHGFNDAARNFMGETAPAFAAGGVAVYAYDQRGFGGAPHRGVWAGAEALAADAVTAAGLIRARHPGVPLYLLGESMGGAIAILAGTGPNPAPVDGYILSAPAVWGRAQMTGVMRWGLWFASRAFPLVGFYASAGGIAATDNLAAMRRWGLDPLTLKATRADTASGLVDLMDAAVADISRCCRNPAGPVPSLVLLGGNDQVMPARIARRVLREELPRQPQDRVAFYEGGYHLLLRDLGRGVVIGDLLAWMAGPAAPLPSRADRAGRDWIAAATPVE